MTNLDQQFKEAASYFKENKKKVRSSIEKWLGRDYEENKRSVCEDCGEVVIGKDVRSYIDRTSTTTRGKITCCNDCYEKYMDQIVDRERLLLRNEALERDRVLAITPKEDLVWTPTIGNPATSMSMVGDFVLPTTVGADEEVNKLKRELAFLQSKLKINDENSKPKSNKQKKKAKRRIEL